MALALAKKLILLRGKVQGTDSLLIMRGQHVRNQGLPWLWSSLACPRPRLTVIYAGDVPAAHTYRVCILYLMRMPLHARLDTEMLDACHAAVPFAVFADFGEC